MAQPQRKMEHYSVCLVTRLNLPRTPSCRSLCTDETVHRKRAFAAEFAQWAQQHLIVADNLNCNSAAQFVTRLPARATRVALERATVRLFLRHLYTRGRLQRPCAKEAASGPDSYLRRYKDYVRKNRGLTENSVHVYAPFICDFSADKPCRRALSAPTRLRP